MNKAFTREADDADEDDVPDSAPALPSGSKNYMTPGGFARMKEELDRLVGTERPELVATIAWAAGNGDRSENGDYIYGKKRLREVDRRIRFLIRRLDSAEVVDPTGRAGADDDDRIFFGATVDVEDAKGVRRTVSIVGVDEIDTTRGLHQLGVADGARADQGERGRHGHGADARGAGGARNTRCALRTARYGCDAGGEPMNGRSWKLAPVDARRARPLY